MTLTRRSILNSFALATADALTNPLRALGASPQVEPLTDPQRPAFHLQLHLAFTQLWRRRGRSTRGWNQGCTSSSTLSLHSSSTSVA